MKVVRISQRIHGSAVLFTKQKPLFVMLDMSHEEYYKLDPLQTQIRVLKGLATMNTRVSSG